MKLEFYVTTKELARGGQACEITHDCPKGKVKYVKVLSDTGAYAGRGCNRVYFKNTLLAEEIRCRPRNSIFQRYDESDMEEPSIGLLEDAMIKAREIGLI